MKRLLRRIRLADVLTFLLFFALAAVIWYGHAMQSVRNTHLPVHIHYTGKPHSIGLGGEGLPDTVIVQIRDAGKRLNTYLEEPLHLTIDLRTYIHGSKGTIRIPSDALRRSISDILQGTSNLISTSPEEIVCPFFTEETKIVPIALNCEIGLAQEYQLVGSPKLSQKEIKLYGQEKILQAIDTIRTQHMVLNDLNDTTDVRMDLVIPEGVRSDTDHIQVCIMTERYTEKKFTIPLQAHNIPEGYRIRLFPQEVEVSLRVGMNHFEDVQAKDIQAICTYSADRKDKLVVELQYTNPYITAAWAYPGVVEFLLEQ